MRTPHQVGFLNYIIDLKSLTFLCSGYYYGEIGYC